MIKTYLNVVLLYRDDDRKRHRDLIKELNQTPGRGRLHNVWHGMQKDAIKYTTEIQRYEIELDPAHLFDNQWNGTIEGDKAVRVFDLYDGMSSTRNARFIHWLDITDEMIAIRRNTYACGYCGHKVDVADKGDGFCNECIDSDYLSQDQLHLLKLVTVAGSNKVERKITPEQREMLKERFLYAQRNGKPGRENEILLKQIKREDEEKDRFLRVVQNAQVRLQSVLKLDDIWPRTSNLIIYDRSGEFHFGWRTGLARETIEKLQADLVAVDFQSPYKITGETGVDILGNQEDDSK